MNTLVISPHPDDETLGAGGTLLKLKEARNKVYWLNVTNMKKEYGYSPKQVDIRNRQIEQVGRAYGFDGFWNMELKPAALDTYETGFLISRFKEVFDSFQPELLLLPSENDVHSDHRIVFDCAYACTKYFRSPYVKTILSMEIISETEQAPSGKIFDPNLFVDVSQYIDRKLQIMQIYSGEIGTAPFPRNLEAIKGLSAYRGAASAYSYAEAFKIVRSRMD